MEFKPSPLFGGAIVADLPAAFQDVSDIRQIPDTQEVYLDPAGYTSILFDILEQVTDPAGDLEALNFHLSDVVDDDGGDAGDVGIIETGRRVEMGKMGDFKAYTLTAKAPPGEKQRGRAHEPEFVGLFMLLVRLEKVETDLVVTVSVPCGTDGATDEERLLDMGREIRERVVRTLEVTDWGLFGQE